jgi:hypothetical protein
LAATGGASKTDGKENKNSLNKSGLEDEEDFFDFLTRFQSKRMDDQRCSLVVAKKPERFDFNSLKFIALVFRGRYIPRKFQAANTNATNFIFKSGNCLIINSNNKEKTQIQWPPLNRISSVRNQSD